MIYYSSWEILISVLLSVAYGICFSFVLAMSKSVVLSLKKVKKEICYARVEYSRGLDVKNDKSILKHGRKSKFAGDFYVATVIVAFAIGYILMSYYALDGAIRIYTLVLAFLLAKLSFAPLTKLATFSVEILIFPIKRVIFYAINVAFKFSNKRKTRIGKKMDRIQ